MHVDARSIAIMRRRGDYWRQARESASSGATPPLLAAPVGAPGERAVLLGSGGVHQLEFGESGVAQFLSAMSGCLQDRASEKPLDGLSARVLRYVSGAVEEMDRGSRRAGVRDLDGFGRDGGLGG